MIYAEGFCKFTTHDLKSDMNEFLGEYSIQYKIGEWIYPKVGKIFVAREYDNFYATNNAPRKFQCQVINPTLSHGVFVRGSSTLIKSFWQKTFYKPGITFDKEYWVVDAVKLVREIPC